MAPKRNRPEQAIQRAVVQYLGIMENLGELFYYAVPNGGLRSKIEASIFKSLGVRAGVSDLVLLFPGGKCAFIEIKSDKGRLSTAQQAFKKSAEYFGFPYAECRGVDQVEKFVRGLIANRGRGVEADAQHAAEAETVPNVKKTPKPKKFGP